jgi:manganese/iron transport system permease protein/iron/zinc/copper transport system permease protein
MMMLAALFGVTSVIGGLYLCVWLDSAGGGAVMLFCTLQFLVVLTVAPKYGLLARWLRLSRMVPQQTVEDVLTTILRHGKPAAVAVIRQYAESSKGLGKVLRHMVRDGLLERRQGNYGLSEKGEKEAAKVLRAHRLWEAYLERIGTPQEALHATAHHLEHLRGRETVDYLDEKLGRPEVDPHGRTIPARKDNGAEDKARR